MCCIVCFLSDTHNIRYYLSSSSSSSQSFEIASVLSRNELKKRISATVTTTIASTNIVRLRQWKEWTNLTNNLSMKELGKKICVVRWQRQFDYFFSLYPSRTLCCQSIDVLPCKHCLFYYFYFGLLFKVRLGAIVSKFSFTQNPLETSSRIYDHVELLSIHHPLWCYGHFLAISLKTKMWIDQVMAETNQT